MRLGMKLRSQKNRNRIIVAITAATMLLILVLAGGLIFRDRFTKFPGPLTVNIESGPRFVFDAEKFPDWISFGNVWDSSDDEDDESPAAIISATQCTEGSNCSSLIEKCRVGEQCELLERYTADSCFINAYYFNRQIDMNTVVVDELEKWTSVGTSPEEIGVETLNMQTSEGDKQYQLYKYDTHNSGYRQGSAFGFVPLSEGHVEVRSVCWQADQLDDTLPALNAIRLVL